MKTKSWDVGVLDNPNIMIATETDDFYTADTEAFLVFKLKDSNFNPHSALLTLVNQQDGSVISETVPVKNKIISYEMREEVIKHAGTWLVQLVYTQDKEGAPENYTSRIISFSVGGHLMDKKQPTLVAIENWESFILNAKDLLENWESQLQEHLEELLRGESEIHRAEAESKKSALKAQQALSDYLSMLGVDVATLGADGKLSANQLPALAINDTHVVHSKEEIVALVAERGDVAILVHDENVSDAYILTVDEPNVLDNWIKLGVSYVAKAGHAETATIAVDSQKINGHRVVALSEEEYNLGAKDPETVYLVGEL